ncbi:MAG: TolC family protein [Bacteroidota bacterium]
MSLRFYGAWLLAMLIWAPTAQAQAAPPAADGGGTSLGEILAQVSAAHPTLTAAQLRADALALRTRQVPLWPDPEVGLTVMPLPVFTAKGAQRSQWQVRQQVPYLGQRDAQVAHAAALAAEAEATVGMHRADLLQMAKDAYYTLFLTQMHRTDLQAFAEEVAQFEQAATAQYEVGEGGQQAILMAQIERNRLGQRLLEQERRAEHARSVLAQLVGRPLWRLAEASVEALPLLEADTSASLMGIAQAHRSEWQMFDQAQAQARLREQLVGYEAKPSFSAHVRYIDVADSGFPEAATGRDALAVGVNVAVPLQRSRLRADRDEAKVWQRHVEAERELLALRVATDIDRHLSDLRLAQQQIELYLGTLIPQATTTVEATLAAYTAGKIDFINLLDARRTLLSLHMDHHNALVGYLKAVAALERTLGVDRLADVLPVTYRPLMQP